jgi:hypothetical protein
LTTGLVVAAGLAPATALAGDVVYRTAVVAERTAVPEGGTLSDINTYTLDGSRVALTGFSFDVGPTLEGVWKTAGNRLETVVSTETLIPGSQFQFIGFNDIFMDGERTAFVGQYPNACPSDSCVGIYVHEGGDYRLLVDTFQTVPGRDSNFQSLGQPVIDEDQFAFLGWSHSDQFGFGVGIYADFGDGLTTVADSETAIPGRSGNFNIVEYDTGLSIEDGVVYFSATNSLDGTSGYYAWDSTTQAFETLRDRRTLVPGTDRRFNEARSDVHCGGTYAFVGEYANYSDRGVFADFGDGLVKVVDEAGLFEDDRDDAEYFFEQLSACGDAVAFVVYSSDTEGPAVFVYRRSDDSVTRVLGFGDTIGGNRIEDLFITPRSVSGDSVAVNVRLSINFASAIIVASIHDPARRMLVAGDRSGNGYEEIVVLDQDEASGRYVAKLHDAYSGGRVGTVPLGARPVQDFGLLDDPGRKLRVAAFYEASSGRSILDYVVAANGTLQARTKLWQDATPLALAKLPDANDNGVAEVAAAARTVDDVVEIEVREGRSGKRIAAYPVADRFELVTLLSIADVAGVPALVLVGEDEASGRARVLVVDALTGSELYRINLGRFAGAPVLDAVMIDDLDGDGVPELALARTNVSSGKSGWQVWNVVTGTKTAARFTGMQVVDLRITAQPDLGEDGLAELGLLRVKPDGTSVVEIDDPVTAASLGRYRMRALTDGRAIAPLAPIDGNGTAEFVVLGDHFGANLLEVHDSGDGTDLRYFYLP